MPARLASVGSLSVVGDYAEVAANRQQFRKVLTVPGHTAVENRKRPAISVVGSARDTIVVAGKRAMGSVARRRAITITGSTPQTNVDHNRTRETFSVDEARAAMGINWMTIRGLSQAIPPAYSEFIGRQFLEGRPQTGSATNNLGDGGL
jgi:hypothetical protein